MPWPSWEIVGRQQDFFAILNVLRWTVQSVRSTQDWLTWPTMSVSSNHGAWHHLAIWRPACPQVVQYAWERFCMQVGALKHIQERVVPQGKLLGCFAERDSVMDVANTSELHRMAGCGEVEQKYGPEHTNNAFIFKWLDCAIIFCRQMLLVKFGCCGSYFRASVAWVYARSRCFDGVRAIPKVRCLFE